MLQTLADLQMENKDLEVYIINHGNVIERVIYCVYLYSNKIKILLKKFNLNVKLALMQKFKFVCSKLNKKC